MSETAKLKPFIAETQIQTLIDELAEKINHDYAKLATEEKPVLIVVTLKGATFFAADLIRKLTIPVQVDFVRLKSYGSGTSSSGEVKLLRKLEASPKGRHLLILDEIVDSGHSLNFLTNYFEKQNPATLKICTLLNKPSRRQVEVHVDYIGSDVKDEFLVGYGLDHDEKYRNLKEIYYI